MRSGDISRGERPWNATNLSIGRHLTAMDVARSCYLSHFPGKSLGSGEARKAQRVRGAHGGAEPAGPAGPAEPTEPAEPAESAACVELVEGLVVCANAFLQRDLPLHQIDQLLVGVDVELGVHVLHVGLHGVARHDERLLDVAAVSPAGEHGEHLGLAGRE